MHPGRAACVGALTGPLNQPGCRWPLVSCTPGTGSGGQPDPAHADARRTKSIRPRRAAGRAWSAPDRALSRAGTVPAHQSFPITQDAASSGSGLCQRSGAPFSPAWLFSALADALPGNIAAAEAVGRMEIASGPAVVRVGRPWCRSGRKWCRGATRPLRVLQGLARCATLLALGSSAAWSRRYPFCAAVTRVRS
jgi:hypothetical protein